MLTQEINVSVSKILTRDQCNMHGHEHVLAEPTTVLKLGPHSATPALHTYTVYYPYRNVKNVLMIHDRDGKKIGKAAFQMQCMQAEPPCASGCCRTCHCNHGATHRPPPPPPAPASSCACRWHLVPATAAAAFASPQSARQRKCCVRPLFALVFCCVLLEVSPGSDHRAENARRYWIWSKSIISDLVSR
jgi:hypothetical protein